MYLDFYGLREKPFALTSDPRFLHLGPGHREALGELVYGLRERAGFMLLTGDVGTGKTTLVHALRQRVNGTAAVAVVVDPTLPFDDLLASILRTLGVSASGASRAERLAALRNFATERSEAGQTTVLIFDEAHHFDVPALEQVRLLSNFDTPTDKLLQILLVGQPELRAKLDRPEVRPLTQRIGIRASIRPLTEAETRRYILARLRTAGAADLRLFKNGAIRRIARYTRGIPRLVNVVCDHCLLIGYADQRRRIERETVGEAIRYLEGRNARRAARGRSTWKRTRLPWVLAALTAGAGLVLLTAGIDGTQETLNLLATDLVQWARSAREVLTR